MEDVAEEEERKRKKKSLFEKFFPKHISCRGISKNLLQEVLFSSKKYISKISFLKIYSKTHFICSENFVPEVFFWIFCYENFVLEMLFRNS